MPLLWMLAASACAPWDLDHVDGQPLGVPGSAAYGLSEIGEIMVVFSDLPDICERMWDPDPPEFQDWWVVSVWSRSAPRVDERLPSYGYVAVSVYDEVRDYEALDAWVDLERIDPESVRGQVYVELDSGDRLRAHFEAPYCDAPMFAGQP